MKIQLPALFLLCMLVFASTAGALETDELLAITAMPLAVADVVALPDVPRNDVVTVVTTLNQAAVPAPQFVEIVRYVPVALVEPAEPRFVTYVTQEYRRGIVGEPLALAIANRYNAYGIEDIEIVDPPVMTLVERREILPQVVVTRFQTVELDPLALIAMPLAVAAVADLADVPRNDLIQFVTSLNQARVPAPQFVEVVRYSPVVFVDRTESPQFIRFVTTEVDRGVIGRPLAFSIARRFETFRPMDIDVYAPRLIVDRPEILPPVVVTRVAKVHPHGGPPGQLRKQVVHDTRPNRGIPTRTIVVDRDDRRERQPRVIRQERPAERAVRRNDDNPRSRARVARDDRGSRRNDGNVKQRGRDRDDDRRGNSGSGKGKRHNGKGKG